MLKCCRTYHVHNDVFKAWPGICRKSDKQIYGFTWKMSLKCGKMGIEVYQGKCGKGSKIWRME